MIHRTDYPLDIQPGPWPSAGLIGFVRGAEDEAYQPMYSVTQADWDDIPDFWKRRRSVTKLDVVGRELNEVGMMLIEITGEKGEGVYTDEFRKRAKRVAEKVNQAIDALYKDGAE